MGSKWIVLIFALVLFSGCDSNKKKSLDQGNWVIKSDCVSPSVETTVQTLNSNIVAGASSFTDFGFPNSIVRLGQDNTGFVLGKSRTCSHSYGDDTSDDFVYSCVDNGNYTCTIFIRPL